MTGKEKDDMELALKLQKEGIIITPGKPFKASNKQEINSLISRGVFSFKKYDNTKYKNT